MSNSPADSYVYRQSFDDLDELTEQARQWHLDFWQLGKGRFRGEIKQMGAFGVHLSEARFRSHLRQKGMPPAGMRTIAIPARKDIRLKWRGCHIDGDSMMVFPRGSELSSVSGPDFHVYTCSFPEELLGQVSETLGIGTLDRLCSGSGAIKIPPQHAAALRYSLHDVFEIVHEAEEIPEPTCLVKAMTDGLAGQAMSSVASATGHCPSVATVRRLRAVQTAETYIEQHVSEDLRVRDIAKFACVSERTLEYAFVDRFGISPRQYLKSYRLCLARRHLLTSDRSSSRVTDIANECGFWHMGQFAADYQDFYAELPSETLRGSSEPASALV